MKLLIDIGNSRLKWAWSSAEGIIRFGDAVHRNRDFSAALAELPSSSAPPVEVRVANVAGPIASKLVAEAVYERFGIRPVFARASDAAYGLKSGYRIPGQLGIDRWLAMCAAWQKLSGPLCVVDAGTAITIDAIRADGVHSGGLILPGIGLMTAVLRQETGDLGQLAGLGLPHDIRIHDGFLLGTDTTSAIQLGAARAIVAVVTDCLSGLNAEVGGAKLAITGGDGAWLASLLGIPTAYYPGLVLEGLALEPACYSVG